MRAYQRPRQRPECQILWSLLAALMVALLLAAPASAATGDIGFVGPSTSGTGGAPTGEKPESKLWWNDGRWWATIFNSTSRTYHIWWLNRSTSPETWVDTGTQLDDRPQSRADTLWDGSHLYVASAVFASSNTNEVSGNPTRLYRYSYDPLTRGYRLDLGYPVAINNTSVEAITLDKDSTGRLWATWTQGQRVFYNATTAPGADSSWGTPATLPASSASGLDPDDISSLVAFGKPASQGGSGAHIGVMWSNQTASTTYFSVHNDGDPVDSWQPAESVTIPGPRQSDDHLNVKQLDADTSGRIWAVIKTSLDDLAGVPSSAPQIVVLSRGATGGWSRATFGTISDCHTRPVLMLDSTNRMVHVYATAPDSGCPFTGTPGSIFEKTSPMDNLSFSAGRGTAVMRDAASPSLNNVSGSKQSVNAASGIVMIASNDTAKHYWSSDEPIAGQPAAPSARFTASPSSGSAPLAVQFTDSSSGAPTSWSWDFGDGTSSTQQNPQHTYTDPGTYTARLQVANSAGSDTASTTITVSAAPPPGGIAVVGSQESKSTAAVSTVTLAAPAGVTAGDVLVAAFTVDNGPTITAPAGWTRITALRPGGGSTVSAYYHLVFSGESATSYSWALSSAQKWGGGLTAYRGVSASNPLDVASPATNVDGSGSATSLTAPGVTTATDGAMLIGGLGADGSTASTTPPSGWTEGFDSVGGKMAEHAYKPQAAAGASGPATWTISSGRALAVWMTALRPG